MKINKKIIVPFLSTIVGLSVAGGLGGAFAWYQFNSQVRTGFIGSSVADTGVVEIGYDDPDHPGSIIWGSSRILTNETDPTKHVQLIPVTFDQLNTDGTLKSTAYGYPEAGKQIGEDYSKGWKVIENGHGYVQYDIYLRTLKADSTAAGDSSAQINPGYKLVSQDVYLSKITLEGADADQTTYDSRVIADALRVHYQVSGTLTQNHKNDLISNTAVTNMALSGPLDLDGIAGEDLYDVDPWDPLYGQTANYGIPGHKQTTHAASAVIQDPDANTVDVDKRICTTETGASMVKITITVWLEGWAALKVDGAGTTSQVWNPKINAGIDVHVGMVFDVGEAILG